MKLATDIAVDKIHGVIAAWQKFLIAGQLEVCNIRPQIMDSWDRCYHLGVDPYRTRTHRRCENNQLILVREQNQDLIDVAQPFMANLYHFVEDSGFVVVLTDKWGYILEAFGDNDILQNPMTSNFFQGACWSEQEAGTNAIGTALALRKPIQVSGAEHYCRQHHCLTCSAAPIWDSRGQLIGILDLSGASYLTHLHTLGMVVAAAAAIMAQLVIQQKNRELTLTNKRLTNVFNTMSDGVLVIDQYGIINELNPVAKTIIGKSKEEILGLPAEKLFGDKSALYHKILRDKESFVDVEITTYTGKGCLAAGEPITDERGNVTGGLIILRPLKQIKNLVNRFNGNYGTLQFSDIIGTSKGILEAIRVASLAANSIANVLLQGESGTGKEIFAQAIHNRSERNNGPFIAVNCGAIPRELIGSELFGYEEGSFTGARRGGKPGKFELAAGGTLFLDEIGDMPLEQQVSLLRVLQDRKVVRIGGDKVIPVDVRVICATNKNLLTEVDIGKFRKDLYYRLNVISIIIPPLRERVEDIVLLFGYFLEKMDKKLGRVFCIQPEVIERITCYDWPGNVRELQNVVERIISLTEDQNISLAHLPTEFNPASGPAQQSVLPLVVKIAGDRQERRRRVAESERQEIMLLLNEHGGNISVTAQQLGVSRNTLYRKMRLYDIKN